MLVASVEIKSVVVLLSSLFSPHCGSALRADAFAAWVRIKRSITALTHRTPSTIDVAQSSGTRRESSNAKNSSWLWW